MVNDTIPIREGNQIWQQEEALQIRTQTNPWLAKHSDSSLTTLGPCGTDIILDVAVTVVKGFDDLLHEICFQCTAKTVI